MSAELPPDRPARIVKPRKRRHTHRPVIAVSSTEVLTEDMQRYPLGALPQILLTSPSSIIAVQGFGDALDLLLNTFGHDPLFQYRATPKGEQQITGDRMLDTIVNFVGWMAEKDFDDKIIKPSRYHYPLDPMHFCRFGIDDIYPLETKLVDGDMLIRDNADLDFTVSHIYRLLKWACSVRDWCASIELEVKPSAGGLAAQLLRDPAFYPNDRRKVPRLINETARTRLPGNYYQLHAQTYREQGYTAIYLDMEAAHHAMARRLTFPNANSLHGYGHWSDKSTQVFTTGATLLDTSHKYASPWPGLYHLSVTIPSMAKHKFIPPMLLNSGKRDIWLYSNELDYLREYEIEVHGIISCYVSKERDRGLNKYATFAIDQLRTMSPAEKPWLKPVLHSAYGVLAAKPVEFETGYLRTSGGKEREYIMGRHSFPVRAKRSNGSVEAKVVNVIHRGMIEAAVRKETLDLCKLLGEADGRQILSIYADSVLVRDNSQPLKLLPAPWRIKDVLTDLRFIDATHFTSEQFSRLPGMPRTRDEAARVEAYYQRLERHMEARKVGRMKPRNLV